jgi:hypothetical protein
MREAEGMRQGKGMRPGERASMDVQVGRRWIGALVLQLERESPVVPVEGVFLVSVDATVLEE